MTCYLLRAGRPDDGIARAQISGNNAVAQHLGKLFGIRNGIDTDAWSPSNDKYLPRPYGPDDAIEGKEAAKRELRRRLNLGQMNVPIISVVTRLVAQKVRLAFLAGLAAIALSPSGSLAPLAHTHAAHHRVVCWSRRRAST